MHVTTLVKGQAAVANFYCEGVLQPAGDRAVMYYCTRATEVYVKEDGA